MKITAKVLALVAALTAASQGATTISGTTGLSFKDSTGTNIASGCLILLVVDNGSDGFLNQAVGGAISSSLTGASGKTITLAQAGLTAGTTFGGDMIINTLVSGSGSIGAVLPGSANFDITPYVNKNIAVVWFTTAAGSVTTGSKFGEMRLSDWTLPSADTGSTLTMSPTDANGGTSYYSASTALTALQVGGTGFFTGSGTAADTGSTAVRSAQFTIAAAVPEPSAALLGALGALGLLRRRRI